MAGTGTRLSKQNYCTHCEYREKKDKKVWCADYDKPVGEVIDTCWMLKPFEAYEKAKEEKKNKKVEKD